MAPGGQDDRPANPYAAPAAALSERGRAARGSGRPFQSLVPFARAVTAALATVAVICVVEIGEVVGGLATRVAGALGVAGTEPSVWQLLARAEQIAVVVTAILFLQFLVHATRNAQAFGPRPISFSPARAVGSFFIPFLNLYLPYAAVKELWEISEPDPALRDRPVGPVLVRLWWALFLARAGANLLARRLDSGDDSTSATRIVLIAAGVSIAGALAAVSVVQELTRRQDRRATAAE
jgi:hypothetical protein